MLFYFMLGVNQMLLLVSCVQDTVTIFARCCKYPPWFIVSGAQLYLTRSAGALKALVVRVKGTRCLF